MSATVEAARSPAYAHTIVGQSEEHWEPLEKHLDEVARLTFQFADAFRAGNWGDILGRCHDLGKYSDAFQQYLRLTQDPDAGAVDGLPARIDHSTYGARCVAGQIGKLKGQMLAYCIAGHHAGLPDGSSEESSQRGTLKRRLDKKLYSIPPVISPDELLNVPQLPIKTTRDDAPFQLSFFVRMIFSCLVDADRLATEAFCEPERAILRGITRSSLAALRNRLDQFLQAKQAGAPRTEVNRHRSDVLIQCIEAAQLPPGFFSLTGADRWRQDLFLAGLCATSCL